MKIGFVIGKLVPMHDENGSSVASWAMVQTIRKKGHEVFVIAYNVNTDPEAKSGIPAGKILTASRFCESQGIKVYVIDRTRAKKKWRIPGITRVRKLMFPMLQDVYKGFRFADEVEDIVISEKPDALIAWAVDGGSAIHKARLRVRASLISLTDLDHLARDFRARRFEKAGKRHKYNSFREMSDRKLARQMLTLIEPFEVVINHAHHHSEWLKAQGIGHVQYLPIPVLDKMADRGLDLEYDRQGPARILLVGNLLSAATFPGLELLADEIIPELEKIVKKRRFEIHIIGRGSLPPALREKLNKPYVKFRGYVEALGSELRSCALFFVPTPIELGFRTRIAEAFMYGCCVVAHQANALGMPELVSGKNIILARNGVGLAGAIDLCLSDPELCRRLSQNARETFEQSYDGHRVCLRLIGALEQVFTRSSRLNGK